MKAWFIRPGVASTLIPKAGTAQEWITSVDVVKIRIGVLYGKINRLSTSSNRNWEKLFFFIGNI